MGEEAVETPSRKRLIAEEAASAIFSYLIDNDYVDDLIYDDEDEVKEYLADVVMSAIDQRERSAEVNS